MSYRFIRITDYYEEFLKSYDKKNPLSIELNYEEQHQDIINQSIEIVSSYGKYLRLIGVDAIDIISNATTLQQKWAKEHNFSSELTNDEIVLEQIKYYKPDIVWIDTTRFLHVDWISNLRKEVKGIKQIVGHICAPYNATLATSFLALDVVFTCSPCTVTELKELGVKNVELIYHSFNHSILEQIKTEENPFPQSNLVFTGSLMTGYGLHGTRTEYLENIINSGIDMTLYGNLESNQRIFLKQSFSKTVQTLNKLNLNFLVNAIPVLNKHQLHAEADIKFYSKKLLNCVKPPVFGLDMYKVLAKSNLCFNIHGDIAKKCAGNLRLFEATGVGTCLITDWKENMKDLFDLDKEVVTYNSIEECIDKIKWLVNNPLEMRKIAEAGQKRTLTEHTVEKRVEKVHEILSRRL